MKSIKEIKPDPIVSSVVDVRFKSSLLDSNFINVFYPILIEKYPNLKPVEKTKILAHHPKFNFYNDDFTIGVGSNIISIECNSGYKLWSNFHNEVVSILQQVDKSIQIEKIDRVGVRFGSIFGVSFEEGLNLNVNLGFNELGYKQEKALNFSGLITKDNFNFSIFVADSANIRKKDRFTGEVVRDVTGLYIDVDAFAKESLPKKLNKELFDLIDKLHSEIKIIVFDKILKKEFLKKITE